MTASLEGRVALVTGAASGIGAASARRLAALGASVVLADVDQVTCARLRDELEARGSRAVAIECDVSSRAQTEAAVAAAVEAFEGLDILVNSAGITTRNVGPDADFEAAWDRVMSVNLKGTMLMCHAAVPAMQARGGGAIVNLASVMGLVVYDNHIGFSDGFNAYPHSKGGVLQLTRDLGVQMAKSNIRVNAVCPGFVHTALTDGVTAHPESHQALKDRHPMGRLGEADEIAAVVAFLVSDDASFVTAAAWTVDGGFTAV